MMPGRQEFFINQFRKLRFFSDTSHLSLKSFQFLYFSGVNVLNTKSELERVMEKRNRHRKDQERIVEQQATKTPFQKMLEERAKRLEMIVRF